MVSLQHFLICYFHFNAGFSELDQLLEDFKKEGTASQSEFIYELRQVIDTKNYAKAARVIKQHGKRTFDLETTEKFINYLYDVLLERPTKFKGIDFVKKRKIVFCPVCTPYPKMATIASLVDVATVIANNIQIYICKQCKLVWLDENDIRADNAVAYKEFMKVNGLKGFWNELKDIDVL